MRVSVTTEIVELLAEDSELGRALAGDRLALAKRELRVAAIGVPAGRWNAARHAATAGSGLGLMILEGVLVRRVGRERRFGAELLGPGDLLRPAEDGVELATTPFTTAWRAIEPLRLAVLDQRFVARLAPYPEIAVALTTRSVDRARHVLVHMAIAHHARVDARLELLLWHLADRWGRVTPEGVMLPLRLTHELLADLVAAQRPSVTLSLQNLERTGLVLRRQGTIYLVGEPPGSGEDDGAGDGEPLPALAG